MSLMKSKSVTRSVQQNRVKNRRRFFKVFALTSFVASGRSHANQAKDRTANSEANKLNIDLRQYGSVDGSGKNVAKIINQTIKNAVSTVAKRGNQETVVFYLGNLIYNLDSPILIQNHLVKIVGNGAKLNCNDIATHGIKIDHDNASPNVRWTGVSGVEIHNSVSHGLFIQVGHYCNISNVMVRGCGGDGIRIEGSVSTTTRDCESYNNSGYGYVETYYVKHFDGLNGEPPIARCRASLIVGLRCNYNGKGGISLQESVGCTLIRPQCEVNGGSPSNNNGRGISLFSTLSCQIRDPYFEGHEKHILIQDLPSELRSIDGLTTGHNIVSGGFYGGPRINGKRYTICIEISNNRNIVAQSRYTGHIKINSSAKSNLIAADATIVGKLDDKSDSTVDSRVFK